MASGNALLREAGIVDSAERAREYLRHVTAGETPESRWGAHLDHGPALVEVLRRRTPLAFQWMAGYADYLPELPGAQPRRAGAARRPAGVGRVRPSRGAAARAPVGGPRHVLVHGQPGQHRGRRRDRRRGRRRAGVPGGGVVVPGGAGAGPVPGAAARGALAARADHRERPRRAVRERGAELHVGRSGAHPAGAAGVDGLRPALPRPLRVHRRDLPAAAAAAEWYAAGIAHRAASLDELSRVVGLPGQGLSFAYAAARHAAGRLHEAPATAA